MVSLRWAWAPEPASWLEGAPFLKIPRLGQRSRAEPVYPWDRFPAHPKGAMMIIKSLQQTAVKLKAQDERSATEAAVFWSARSRDPCGTGSALGGVRCQRF